MLVKGATDAFVAWTSYYTPLIYMDANIYPSRNTHGLAIVC